jgi:hypothetical protein
MVSWHLQGFLQVSTLDKKDIWLSTSELIPMCYLTIYMDLHKQKSPSGIWPSIWISTSEKLPKCHLTISTDLHQWMCGGSLTYVLPVARHLFSLESSCRRPGERAGEQQ